jgi:hypothetical protein
MKKEIAISMLSLSLLAVGCDQKEPVANTNVRNANGNSAILMNANGNTATGTIGKADDDDWDVDVNRGDFDKEKAKYEKRAKDSGSTIGSGANDLWIWTKTKAALAGADDLRDSTINVDVENDVVTLKGSVKDAAQKTKAEQTATAIEGVKSVRNQLTLATAGTNSNTAGAKSDTKK